MSNRTSLIQRVFKVLRNHYQPISPPADRLLLEHLLYACCLEDSRPEAADEAFAKLQEIYFDWNEIRVTTASELSETLSGLADPPAAAQRLKKCLQHVFETHYAFDIEFLKKQNLGKAVKELEGLRGMTPFVLAYTTQHGLGGHAIPTCRGTIDAMGAVGVVSEAEAASGRVPGLERAVPKSKGIEQASLLHQFGADYFAAPSGAKVRGILAEIDPAARDRRQAAGDEGGGAESAEPGETPGSLARSPARGKKSAAAGGAAGKSPSKAAKKPSKGDDAAKRSPTKQLTKKKPR